MEILLWPASALQPLVYQLPWLALVAGATRLLAPPLPASLKGALPANSLVSLRSLAPSQGSAGSLPTTSRTNSASASPLSSFSSSYSRGSRAVGHQQAAQLTIKSPRLQFMVRLSIFCAGSALLFHYFFTRCPIFCRMCAGDFYHEMNSGLPWQGPCHLFDPIFSMLSLALGVVGLLLGLLLRAIFAIPLTASVADGVWLVGSAASLRRAVLAVALGYGLFPKYLFPAYVEKCASNNGGGAIGAPLTQRPSIGIVGALAYHRKRKSNALPTCVQEQRSAYAELHGYQEATMTDCQSRWIENQAYLPKMSDEILAAFDEGRFPMGCKYVALTDFFRRAHPKATWALWLDADAIVTNLEWPLERFIPNEKDVDFIFAIGAEDGGDLELPPGIWHSIFPLVPSWSTTGGRWNAGSFLVRNTQRAQRVMSRTVELMAGGIHSDDDQPALFQALTEGMDHRPSFSPTSSSSSSSTADAAKKHVLFSSAVSVAGDIIRLPRASFRAVAPRCLNVHPRSWAPWNRWMPGDFVAHNWGSNKLQTLEEVCDEVVDRSRHASEFEETAITHGIAISCSGVLLLAVVSMCHTSRRSSILAKSPKPAKSRDCGCAPFGANASYPSSQLQSRPPNIVGKKFESEAAGTSTAASPAQSEEQQQQQQLQQATKRSSEYKRPTPWDSATPG